MKQFKQKQSIVATAPSQLETQKDGQEIDHIVHCYTIAFLAPLLFTCLISLILQRAKNSLWIMLLACQIWAYYTKLRVQMPANLEMFLAGFLPVSNLDYLTVYLNERIDLLEW